MSLCELARRHFSDVVDGQKVPFFARLNVAWHRAICPYCRATEKSLRHTLKVAATLKDLPFDEGDGEKK